MLIAGHFAHMTLLRPKGLLAGFHADEPETDVPELTHCGEQWLPTDWRITPHRHAVWELYLQVSGRTRWRVAGRDYRLAEGDFLAVGPGVEHWLAERPRRDYHIYFAGLDLRAILARQTESRVVWLGADHFVARRAGALVGPFGDLMQEVTSVRFGRERGIRLALDRLVLAATRLLLPGGVGRSGIEHAATNRVRYLIEREPERNWRLGELAHVAGVSPAHLRRCFNRDTGVSPRRFVLKTRIDRACRLLAESDAPVTTVALELGFSSSQHFAQAFRRHTGETASRHRQRHRGGEKPINPSL
jgi:AraC-like DNA-binding protein